MNLNLPKFDEFDKHKKVIEMQIAQIESRIEDVDQQIEQYSAQYSELVGTSTLESTDEVASKLHDSRQRKERLQHELELVSKNSYQNEMAREIHTSYQELKQQVNQELQRMYNQCEQVKQNAQSEIAILNRKSAELSERFSSEIVRKMQSVVDSLTSLNPNALENLKREVNSQVILTQPYPQIQ
jgi:hypothetical protein